MKMLRAFAFVGFIFASVLPASAQWQTQNYSVPLGRGPGVTGFGAAAPATAGIPLTSQGASANPAFGPIANGGIQSGAANTYKGSLNGTAEADITIPNCTGVSQALQYANGTGPNCGTIQASTGFDMPTNMGLSASATFNALTINLVNANGGTPSPANPILALFRSTTITTATIVQASITSALSLTIPSGATLGTSSSNKPFRIWIFLEYNGGTPELAVATCSGPNALFGCNAWESTLKTSIVLNASSTALGTLYAPTANAADAVRIIGYCDFSNGLTTAGTWASTCTALQVFGPGVPRPGTVLQVVSSLSGATASLSITPNQTPNLVKFSGSLSVTNNTTTSFLCLRSATTLITQFQGVAASSPSQDANSTCIVLDNPGSISPVTYSITSGGATGLTSFMFLEEIMGALEPANDNAPLEMTG